MTPTTSCTVENPQCTGVFSEGSPDGIYTANNVQVSRSYLATVLDLIFTHDVQQPGNEHLQQPGNEHLQQPGTGHLQQPGDGSGSDGSPGHRVNYRRHVEGCVSHYVNGSPECLPGSLRDNINSTGSVFIPEVATPGNKLSNIEKAIDKMMYSDNIHWCPHQNYFVVKLDAAITSTPFCKLTHSTPFASFPPLDTEQPGFEQPDLFG